MFFTHHFLHKYPLTANSFEKAFRQNSVVLNETVLHVVKQSSPRGACTLLTHTAEGGENTIASMTI